VIEVQKQLEVERDQAAERACDAKLKVRPSPIV
jgi:hypothetical protein